MADTTLLGRCEAVYPPSADAPHEGTGWSWPVRCVRVEHDDDLHLNSGMKWRDITGRDPFDALYDEIVDVCTWARENGFQLAYDWIMERFAEHQNGEQRRPVVTPSRADRQPPASPSNAKGGQGPAGSDA